MKTYTELKYYYYNIICFQLFFNGNIKKNIFNLIFNEIYKECQGSFNFNYEFL